MAAITVVTLAATQPLDAQVAPTADEVARYTGLHAAAYRGDLPALGASTELTDRQGLTPLALARSRGYREMVEVLEGAGARR